jgi:hypothetical protein
MYILIIGFTLFFFGMWYDMPAIGNYVGDGHGGVIFINTYERGIAGFLIACALSLISAGLWINIFDDN